MTHLANPPFLQYLQHFSGDQQLLGLAGFGWNLSVLPIAPASFDLNFSARGIPSTSFTENGGRKTRGPLSELNFVLADEKENLNKKEEINKYKA